MSYFTPRDIAVIAFLIVGGVVEIALAIAGETGWALAVLGVIAVLIGILLQSHHARRRAGHHQLAASNRASRRAAERATSISQSLTADLLATQREVVAMRTEIAAVKGAVEGLNSPPSGPEPVAPLVGNWNALESVARSDGATKTPLGLVGFFGHGNYGDELFVDVFKQFLADRFDLRIIPDLERKPYFSRPVEDKVAEVDAIVMGGGDLVQQWNTDPRYFDRTYLRKPLYIAGVGVPIYHGSDKHQEKPHILRRLSAFFSDPNVRLIGMRDDFSAGWIREKLAPTAPVTSDPDIVCSLNLPPAPKPAGPPILGIVTRQRRVNTPDDYTRLEELAEHAKRRGFRIRHIILGTGSVGKSDLANAPALNVPDKELLHSEDLDVLTRAIGECTVLASMKFHGTVVATMYGVPSIVLIPTNKNRNFMARIGRDDLVASYDSDRLIEIFGDDGPKPIDPRQVEMLRARSTAFMEGLRDQIIRETQRP